MSHHSQQLSSTTKPTSSFHMKTNSSDTLLIQSLKTENEILRSELQSTTKYSAQLRQQIKNLEGIDEERAKLKQLTNQLTAQLNESQEMIETLQHENTTLKMKTKHLSDSLGLESHRLGREHANQFSKITKYAVRVLRGILDEMQNYHRAWLPTYHSGLERELLKDNNSNRFRVATSVEIEKPDFISPHLQSTFHSTLPRDGSIHFQDTLQRTKNENEIEILDLYELLERVDRSILMMKLLGDSKIESVTLVHKELKAQNNDLLSKMNATNKSLQKLQGIHENKLIEFQTMKNDLRNQMEQLQKLYEKQKEDLQTKLKHTKAQLETQSSEKTTSENEKKELKRKLKKMEDDISLLEERVMEQETARITLADELEREKQLHQVTQKEVENLKMIQKFFRSGGMNDESVDNIPKEKLDLMRTINHLMEENRKLKDSNTNFNMTIKKQETQLKLLQNSNATFNTGNINLANTTSAQKNIPSSATPPNGFLSSAPLKQDLHLIASDKLSDSQLTHKILARKIQEDRNQRLMVEDQNGGTTLVGKFSNRGSEGENLQSNMA